MYRRIFIAVLMSALVYGCNKKEPQKLADVPGAEMIVETKLPLTAPSGWNEKQVDGKTFLLGPTFDGFKSSINLAISHDGSKLVDFVDDCEKELTANPNDKRLEKTGFKTDGGIEGIRLVHETAVQGKKVWSTFYSFDAPGGDKHVFTCSVIASRGTELAPVFDQIIRTYKP